MKQTVIAILCIACVALTGCQVYLGGEAMTAATTSAVDAVEAARRADADENTPQWLKSYTVENAKQWREFVRSAKRDGNWGEDFDNVLAGDQK